MNWQVWEKLEEAFRHVYIAKLAKTAATITNISHHWERYWRTGSVDAAASQLPACNLTIWQCQCLVTFKYIENYFHCSYSYLCESVHYNFGREEIAWDLSDQSFKCISEPNEKPRTQTTKCYLGIFLHTLSWSGFRLICVTYWCNATQFVRLKASGLFLPTGNL